ncbi:MAG: DNA primase, partial [Angustibacter sp.]
MTTGRLKAEVIQAVKERAAIDHVVAEQVTLRSAGIGTLEGLCPFHDEKTPSFQVRPQLGVWHCFGCGAGGDVIAFVQQVNHLSFAESVERLAEKYGIPVEYEVGGARPSVEPGRRSRLVDAHRLAAQWYAEQLAQSPQARPGREFLAERGFDPVNAAEFGVGFAPRSGSALLKFLRDRSFTDEELLRAGLIGRNDRGPYDRFRGRLVWPIRDITGDCIAFGARRLFDDDGIAAKYVNTPETPLFKKSQVLYGLDLAKKSISLLRQVVVVEGYTDVMAARAAGVETAIATCGTAFGAEHIRIIRRIIGDTVSNRSYSQHTQHESNMVGQVIFTFDGDSAGQNAAMKAYAEDRQFSAQTFVAVDPAGLDPCELRQQRGDQAVRDLIAQRKPLFEFALLRTVSEFDLEHAPGRVAAMRAAAPIVAQIKDDSMRRQYAVKLATLVGVELEDVRPAVTQAQRALRSGAAPGAQSDPDPAAVPNLPMPDIGDPAVNCERQLLQCAVQVPELISGYQFRGLQPEDFTAEVHRAVWQAIVFAAGPLNPHIPAVDQELDQQAKSGRWVDRLTSAVADPARYYVTDLAVSQIPATDESQVARIATSVQAELAQRSLKRREREVRS